MSTPKSHRHQLAFGFSKPVWTVDAYSVWVGDLVGVLAGAVVESSGARVNCLEVVTVCEDTGVASSVGLE